MSRDRLIGVGGRSAWSTFTDEQGPFSFGGQVPGVYALRATSGAAAGVIGPIAVQAEREPAPVTLELTPAAELCLRVAPGVGDDLEVRVSLDGAELTFPVVSGENRRERLPPGTARVQLLQHADGARPTLLDEGRIVLAAGASAVLELGTPSAPTEVR